MPPGFHPKRSSLTTENAARQSRNRTGKADRKIEDRKMKIPPIFLSSIFLSFPGPPQSPSTRKLSRSLPTISTIAVHRTQRRPGGWAKGRDHLAGAGHLFPKFTSLYSLYCYIRICSQAGKNQRRDAEIR